MQGIGKHSGSHTSFLSTSRLPIETEDKNIYSVYLLLVCQVRIENIYFKDANTKAQFEDKQYCQLSVHWQELQSRYLLTLSCTPDNPEITHITIKPHNTNSSSGYQGYSALWAASWWLCVSKTALYQLSWSLISLSGTMFLSLMRPVLKPGLIARLRGHKVCGNNGERWLAEMACIGPLINLLIGRVTRPSLWLGDRSSQIGFYPPGEL